MKKYVKSKQKLLLVGILSLLSLGREGYCKEINKVPFIDKQASGKYEMKKNMALPSKSRNDIGIVVHSDGKPGTEVNVLINGKLNYDAVNDYGQVQGIVYVAGRNKNKMKLIIAKGAAVKTSGENSDAVYLTGENTSLINKGEISVSKSPGFNKDTPSRYGLFFMGSSSGINEKEGVISTSGIGSSAVLTGGYAASGYDSSHMPEQFINKGTIQGFGTAHGITGLRDEGQNHTIVNEGTIEIRGGGSGVTTPKANSNKSDIIFKNYGLITAEKGMGISFGGKITQAHKSAINLEAGSNIKVAGAGAVGVKAENTPVYSLGDNTITNTGKDSKAVEITRGTLEVKKGILKVINDGVDTKGVHITDHSALNISKGELHILANLNNTGTAQETYYGVKLAKQSKGKISKEGTLKITSSKLGGGALQLEDGSEFTSEGKLFLDNTQALANGITITDSKLNLAGETEIINSENGVAVEKNAVLTLKEGSTTKLKDNIEGLRIYAGGTLKQEPRSKLTITSISSSTAPQNWQDGIIVMPGANPVELKGTTEFDLDNTSRAGTGGHCAILNESGKPVTLKAGSHTNMKLRKMNLGISVGKPGSQFIMERGSTLKGDIGESMLLGVTSKAVAKLDGDIAVSAVRPHGSLFFIAYDSTAKLSHKLNVNDNSKNAQVFKAQMGEYDLLPSSQTNVNMNGNHSCVIRVMDEGKFTAHPQSTLNINVKGNANRVLFADGYDKGNKANSIVLNGSTLNLEGKDSTVAYALKKNSSITLKDVKVTCTPGNDFYRVEEGGTVNLVRMDNKNASMGTLTQGTINMDNTFWSGKVFHGKASATGTQGIAPIVAGDLNINLKKSSFSGLTEVEVQDPLARINVNIDKDSAWHILADNHLKGTLQNEGRVEFANPKYDKFKTLEVDNYIGSAGSVSFTTDLANELGDKLVIKKAAPKTRGFITVKDKSLLTKQTVTGNKKILLVEDLSGQTQWEGKSLATGGLWDVTPNLVKGEALGLNNTNWYLHKLKFVPTSKVKKIKSIDANTLGIVRTLLTDSTLEERGAVILGNTAAATGSCMGTITEEGAVGGLCAAVPEAGIWTKIQAGETEGYGLRNRYKKYQIGYDRKYGDNTLYGLAISHNRGTTTLTEGNGHDSFTALSLYGTKYLSDGFYSGIVLHAGKLRSDTKLFGTHPDRFNQGSWFYGASYALGKKFNYKQGWFVEPQGKIGYASLQGQEFVTDKGMKIKTERVHSILGKTGVVLGRKVKDGEYYLKTHLLREFKGRGRMHASVLNNLGVLEQGDFTRDYKDSWFEVGFGTNVKLSKNTYFHGDLVKTFGADIRKKWQGTVGLKFAF